MTWYFVENGDRVGPLEDDAFARCVREGRVTSETQVWHEGMENWQTYATVQNAAAVSGYVDPESVRCAECGRQVSANESIILSGKPICAECKPMVMQKMTEGTAVQGPMDYAGFWIRFGAKLIDGIILWIINLGMGLVIALLSGTANALGPRITAAATGSFLQMLVTATYTTYFLGKFAATPGKMACGIRVVTADGGNVSYLRALGRHFAEFLSSIILMIGYIMAAFDDEKRALHDRICNTRVIKN